jgi:hypothetical protein
VIVDNPRSPAARALEGIAQQLFVQNGSDGRVIEAVPETEVSTRRQRRRWHRG